MATEGFRVPRGRAAASLLAQIPYVHYRARSPLWASYLELLTHRDSPLCGCGQSRSKRLHLWREYTVVKPAYTVLPMPMLATLHAFHASRRLPLSLPRPRRAVGTLGIGVIMLAQLISGCARRHPIALPERDVRVAQT